MCRQAIKLRKLDSVTSTSSGLMTGPVNATTAADLSTILEATDLNDSSMFMSASAFLHDTTHNMNTSGSGARVSLGGVGSSRNSSVFLDYFGFSEVSTDTSSSAAASTTTAHIRRLSVESRRSTMAFTAAAAANNYALRQADLKFWDALVQMGALNLIYASIQDATRTHSRLDEALDWFHLLDVEEESQTHEYTKCELDVSYKI